MIRTSITAAGCWPEAGIFTGQAGAIPELVTISA